MSNTLRFRDHKGRFVTIRIDLEFRGDVISDFMDRREKRFLNRVGATIRKIARRSIRPGGKKKKKSQPGEAPRWHVKGMLKDRLIYRIDPRERSVVVGPLGQKNPDILYALEYGGETKTKIKGKTETISIEERPFMRPAREEVDPMLERFFAEA